MKQFSNNGIGWAGIGSLLFFISAISLLIVVVYWLALLHVLSGFYGVFAKYIL